LIAARRTRTIRRRTVAVTARRDTFGGAIGPVTLAANAGVRATRTRRTHFVHRDSAVAVFIEFKQSFRGVLYFVLIDHAVVIDIKHGEKRRNHRALPWSAGNAGAISVRPILVRRFTETPIADGRALTAWRARLVGILGQGHRRQRKPQRHQECSCVFHNLFFVSRR
jgi:hypothetical protein